MAQLPEPTKRTYTKWDSFAEKLVEYAKTTDPDHAWMRWPEQHRLSKGTKNVYRSRVNGGQQWGPGFESATRGGILWVRYVGEGNLRK